MNPLPRQTLDECLRSHRAEYSATLDDLREAGDRDLLRFLEGIMFPAWSHAYRELYPHEASVFRFDYREAIFAFDQSSDERSSPRAVAVLARSVAFLGWSELVGALRANREDARERKATVKRIAEFMSDERDGASRARARAIRQAVCDCVIADGATTAEVVAAIAKRAEGAIATSSVLERLATVASALEADCQDKCVRVSRPSLSRERRLVWDDFLWLEQLAAHVDASHGARKALDVLLRGDALDPIRFLEDRLEQDVSEAMLQAIDKNLSPLLDRQGPRARDLPLHRFLTPRSTGSSGTNAKKRFDLGHYVPHAAGGPSNVNLFRQDRYLNRGWSDEGRRFRAMEAFSSTRPGTIYFVRPLYEDGGDIPKLLEVGVLLEARLAVDVSSGGVVAGSEGGPYVWWLDVFDNQPQPAGSTSRVDNGHQ